MVRAECRHHVLPLLWLSMNHHWRRDLESPNGAARTATFGTCKPAGSSATHVAPSSTAIVAEGSSMRGVAPAIVWAAHWSPQERIELLVEQTAKVVGAWVV